MRYDSHSDFGAPHLIRSEAAMLAMMTPCSLSHLLCTAVALVATGLGEMRDSARSVRAQVLADWFVSEHLPLLKARTFADDASLGLENLPAWTPERAQRELCRRGLPLMVLGSHREQGSLRGLFEPPADTTVCIARALGVPPLAGQSETEVRHEIYLAVHARLRTAAEALPSVA